MARDHRLMLPKLCVPLCTKFYEYNIAEQRKSSIKTRLKYIGGCTREAGTWIRAKLFYRLKMLPVGILSIWIGRNPEVTWKLS